MSEQKQERTVRKIGTHGKTLGSKNKSTLAYGNGNPELTARKPTIREVDPAEWKARKLRKTGQKTHARERAKAQGHRMGRFVGGGACCKRPKCDAILRFNGMGETDVRDGSKNECRGVK
jgi:hypothetical protein